MREKQLPVNENVFNALIMGHSYADDFESAAGILGVMTQAGLEPSSDTYTTLLCGIARKGDVEAINNYIAQCEEKDIFLLDKDYLEIVYALAINGHADKIDGVLVHTKKAFGYNQDAVNTILRLINRGQEEAAMKVLKTMPRATRMSGELSDAGNFLIKQLIKANRPVEQILSICNELEESRMNAKPIVTAVEAALTYGNSKVAPALLKEMQAKGIELRQHYFWPLFCATKNHQQVLETISMLNLDFSTSPSNLTIRDYIIPRLLVGENYNDVIQTLRNTGITTATAASTTAFFALFKGNMEKAAEIMGSYEAYYSPGLFRKPLLNALSQTKDYTNYVKILRAIHDNLARGKVLKEAQSVEEDDEAEVAEGVEATEAVDEIPVSKSRSLKELQVDVVGDLLLDATIQLKTNRVEAMENILQLLVDQGLTINSYKAERIQERIGEGMTAELSSLLGKLSSGELEPIALERQKIVGKTYPVTMDTEGFEKLIARMEEKGENAKSLKRQLLVSAIRSKNIEKTEEVIERLKAEGYTLTSGVYAQLVDLYATSDKIEEALNAYKKIRETDPEFELDEIKMIKIVQAFVNAERIDEAIKFLEENKPSELDEKAFNYQSTCWRLLNSLAEKGKKAELDKIFNALVTFGYIVPNNVLLGPLIKVHLVNDGVKEAVDKFEEVSQKYRATPWKNELACRLIQAEDAVNLQRITDLSTEIHGEVNSLYDLVFSFIECGRVRQARKILETPGLRTRPGRINYACERYVNEGMPTALEGLMEATKDLSHIDRSEIYSSLLQTYIKEVAPEKALGLWTLMQEEDISPSDAFLVKLASFLQSQNQAVPFHVPTIPEAAKEKPKEVKPVVMKTERQRQPVDSKPEVTKSLPLKAFRNALKSGNVEDILKTRQNLESMATLSDRSSVIEALVRNDRIEEATKLVFELLEQKTIPIPRIFRFYLNKVAAAGDTKTIEDVGKHLTSEQKKVLSFDNRHCHSFVAKGKGADYLQKLEHTIDNAKTEEQIAKAAEEFPRGGSIGILESDPQHLDRFTQIAKKYAEKDILGPVNVLWCHLFVNNDPKADDVFKAYLTDLPRLMFQRVIQIGREKQDETIVQRLIELLHDAKVSEGAIGNAYSCLIDINAAKNDADACLKSVDNCVKDVSFELVNRTALLRAKECVEKAGKKFPHTIPEKKTKTQDTSSSSSSSSSDDEVTRKQKA